MSAKELADLCDRTGITENNIRALAAKYADSPGFIVGGIATTLTSYANAVGDRGDYRAARRALMLAVTLKPRHVSAWMSLALCEYQLRDCTASSGWATKVLQFEPDPESDDPWEQGLALALSPEGERIAAEALGAPDMVGAWRQMQDQMRAIVTACERMAAR